MICRNCGGLHRRALFVWTPRVSQVNLGTRFKCLIVRRFKRTPESQDMGRLFADGTPEEKAQFIEKRRKEAFLAACRWPLSWYYHARQHKMAADALYEIAHAAHERYLARSRAKIETMRRMPPGARPVRTSKTLEDEQEVIDYCQIHFFDDYLLLAGYGLECLFKGALLMMRPELVENEQHLDRQIRTHDLCQLADECAIQLSEEEAVVLRHITREVMWGKYAGPVKLKDMPSPVDRDDQKKWTLSGVFKRGVFHEHQIKRLVDGVYQRAHTRFMEVWTASGESFPIKLTPAAPRSSGWWVSDGHAETPKTP